MLGFNLMWLTILPATYAMLRAIVLSSADVRRSDAAGVKGPAVSVGGRGVWAFALGLMATRHWHWIGIRHSKFGGLTQLFACRGIEE